MLHSVPQLPGPHLFCGPTAICAVTGLDQYDVLAAAHRYMARPADRPIVGMTEVQLTGTLALLGYACTFVTWTKDGRNPTLWQFMHDTEKFEGPRILSLSKHYCAVTYDEYTCNQVDGKVIPIAHAPNMRMRVKAIIGVWPL